PEPMKALAPLPYVHATSATARAVAGRYGTRDDGTRWVVAALDRALPEIDGEAALRTCLVALVYAHEAGRGGGGYFGWRSPSQLEAQAVRRLLKALESHRVGADAVAR